MVCALFRLYLAGRIVLATHVIVWALKSLRLPTAGGDVAGRNEITKSSSPGREKSCRLPQAFLQIVHCVVCPTLRSWDSGRNLAKDQRGFCKSANHYQASVIQMWVTISHFVGYWVWSQAARFQSASIVIICLTLSKLISLLGSFSLSVKQGNRDTINSYRIELCKGYMS